MMATDFDKRAGRGRIRQAGALGRRGRSVIRDFNLWYGDFQALKGTSLLDIPQGPRHGLHRPLRLRASRRCCARSTACATSCPRVRTEGAVELAGARRLLRATPTQLRVHGGHGVPAPQPLPDEHPRQRAVRAAPACASSCRARGRRDSWSAASRDAGPLGRGARTSSTSQRPGTLRWPAAAPVHRARPWPRSPEVLLMDEPTSALDPISTAQVEELMVRARRASAPSSS